MIRNSYKIFMSALTFISKLKSFQMYFMKFGIQRQIRQKWKSKHHITEHVISIYDEANNNDNGFNNELFNHTE
jgi:hypothetical protein